MFLFHLNPERINFSLFKPLRSAIYNLLASLMRGAPDGETLLRIESLELCDDSLPDLKEAWEELRKMCGKLTQDQIASEYEMLFMGRGQGELIPYASWYIDGTTFSNLLEKLRTDMAEMGIFRAPGAAKCEDHAATLCETMSILSRDSRAASFKSQVSFFETYLKPWMNQFFQQMTEIRWTVFYHCVGRLAQCFLDLESIYISHNSRRIYAFN